MNELLEKNNSTWQLKEIDFGAIRKELVRDDDHLFYLWPPLLLWKFCLNSTRRI